MKTVFSNNEMFIIDEHRNGSFTLYNERNEKRTFYGYSVKAAIREFKHE